MHARDDRESPLRQLRRGERRRLGGEPVGEPSPELVGRDRVPGLSAGACGLDHPGQPGLHREARILARQRPVRVEVSAEQNRIEDTAIGDQVRCEPAHRRVVCAHQVDERARIPGARPLDDAQCFSITRSTIEYATASSADMK